MSPRYLTEPGLSCEAQRVEAQKAWAVLGREQGETIHLPGGWELAGTHERGIPIRWWRPWRGDNRLTKPRLAPYMRRLRELALRESRMTPQERAREALQRWDAKRCPTE